MDLDPASSEFEGVTTGTAPDVEDPLAGPQPERSDHVVDLLHRALGVGIAVVGRAHVVGQVLEPVVAINPGVSSSG